MVRNIKTFNFEKLCITHINEVKANYDHVIVTRKTWGYQIDVLAVNAKFMKTSFSKSTDYIYEHSRLITVKIREDYLTAGCEVRCDAWVLDERIPNSDRHIYRYTPYDTDRRPSLCVGTPESFEKLSNPILESIRTAEIILAAYHLFLIGETNQVELLGYSHGDKGRKEYEKDKSRYTTYA